MSAAGDVARPYVGRLAPSPTGALHLGNVRTFAIAWLRARAAGGRVVLRIEDLDHPKDKPGADREAVEDLEWLGFDWDATFRQSERKHLYRAALDRLVSSGLAYSCVCSRRDVESAQSAPHAGEQLRYAGTCRGRFAGWADAFRFLNPPGAATGRPPRLPCWRFRVDGGAHVDFDDVFAGRHSSAVAAELGDFPLARDPDGAGYTLAVVVDDAAMGVTEVVRGDDLLQATPAQILVQRALGLPEPRYCHVPLVVGPDGRRLAKRHGDTRIASFREAGASPEDVMGLVAASCGWVPSGARISLGDLLGVWSMDSIPHSPVCICPVES